MEFLYGESHLVDPSDVDAGIGGSSTGQDNAETQTILASSWEKVDLALKKDLISKGRRHCDGRE